MPPGAPWKDDLMPHLGGPGVESHGGAECFRPCYATRCYIPNRDTMLYPRRKATGEIPGTSAAKLPEDCPCLAPSPSPPVRRSSDTISRACLFATEWVVPFFDLIDRHPVSRLRDGPYVDSVDILIVDLVVIGLLTLPQRVFGLIGGLVFRNFRVR